MTTRQGILSAEIVDSYGIPGQVQLFITVDGSQTIDALAADVAAFNLDLLPMTQGSQPVTHVRIDFTGGRATGASGDIEKGALFNFNNATDHYAQGVLVPDVAPTILNGSGLIDLTNTDVTAFIAWLTTAHTVITVVTKGVRALSSLKDALVTFRKHRKPLTRKTKEV